MYFIGNFVHATNQEETLEAERRHGEFSLIVEAGNPKTALKLFKDRIIAYRHASDLFHGKCSIFMVQLFEFDRFPVEEALMLNYKSTAGDPVMPFIRCSLPNDLSDTCRIFDWKNNVPASDGQAETLFLAFEPGAREALNEPDPAFLLPD